MSEVFDGIYFENIDGLLEFLKHSYFAARSRIKTLEADLTRCELELKELQGWQEEQRQLAMEISEIDV